MAMELKIISPAEDGYVKAIEFNYEELKSELERSLEKYQNLAYTDETIQDAKKDRAKLNKLKQALNAKKLEIKSRCLAPYETFESKIKELMGMVENPTKAIDSQVKGYEERKRQEKKARIEEFWNDADYDVKELVPLARVFNDKWLNVSTTMKSIETEITELLEKITSELALIEDLNTEFEDQVVRVYLQGFDIAKAYAENTALLEQKAKREELKRQREEAEATRKAEAASAQPVPTQQAAPEPQAPPVNVAPAQINQQSDEVIPMDFRVWATRDQLTELRSFLNANGIKYGRVTNEQAA